MHVAAINIKQPWANLIASGRKTIEVRSWTTSYRGALVIITSVRHDTHADVEPELLYPRGVTICAVELVDVRPLVPRDARRAHMSARDIRSADVPLFAWEIDHPRPLAHHPVRGRLGLYRIPRSVVVAA